MSEFAPQPIRPHETIRSYVDTGETGWKHGELASKLYQMADVFNLYFFSARNESDAKLPTPVIELESQDVRMLAWYRLDHNAVGLKWAVGLNTRHLDRPKWSLYESLVHEMVHLYQESMVEMKQDGFKSCRDNYHNKQFIGIAEDIGLHPKLGEGYHLRVADGQFARLMDRFAVAPPPPQPETPGEGKRAKGDWWDAAAGPKKGSSTLTLYTAEECVKEKNPCKIRSGSKDLHIVCADCMGTFKPHV